MAQKIELQIRKKSKKSKFFKGMTLYEYIRGVNQLTDISAVHNITFQSRQLGQKQKKSLKTDGSEYAHMLKDQYSLNNINESRQKSNKLFVSVKSKSLSLRQNSFDSLKRKNKRQLSKIRQSNMNINNKNLLPFVKYNHSNKYDIFKSSYEFQPKQNYIKPQPSQLIFNNVKQHLTYVRQNKMSLNIPKYKKKNSLVIGLKLSKNKI